MKKFGEASPSLLQSLLKNNEVIIRQSYEPYQSKRQSAPSTYYGAASESRKQDETATESTIYTISLMNKKDTLYLQYHTSLLLLSFLPHLKLLIQNLSPLSPHILITLFLNNKC